MKVRDWMDDEWQDLSPRGTGAQMNEAEQMEGKQRPECTCSLCIRLVGDGCPICNPEYWAEIRTENELDAPVPKADEQ